MSGMFNPTSDGSNSKVQDTLQRASGTPFPPQSSSSNGVLNHSCGTVQGLHKVHGNVSISNVHWPDASGNSANYFGISQCVEQVAANTSNGRTSIINPQNTLSQLNLGGSNGHFTNVGGYGQGIFPYAENTGCIANSLDNLGIGGLGAAGFTNQAGPSHINLTAPQMVNMQGNSYSAQGMPLSPNNNYGFMALLNDVIALGSATSKINEYKFSEHLSSTRGYLEQHGLMPDRTIGYSYQNKEFTIQSEEFRRLPGNQDGLSPQGFSEYAVNTQQNGQIHDNMENLLQYQQLDMGRSSGFGFGDAHSTYRPQQHHHASSSVVPYLNYGNRDPHFHDFEMGHEDVSLQEQRLHMQIPHSNFVSSSRRLNESPIQFPNMNEMAPPTSSLMHVLALSPPLSPVHDPIDLSSASEYSSESENDIPNLQPHPPVMMISSDEEMDSYSTAESRVDND